MTKANLLTWLTPSYPISLTGVSSTPDNNGTKPTIQTVQPYGYTNIIEITSGYAIYYKATSPQWMKIWNVTRSEYGWGRLVWGADWLEFSEDIPATWLVGDEISNAVDGAGSVHVEVWMSTVPSTAVAIEVTGMSLDSTPSGSTLGTVENTDNVGYQNIYPLHATIYTQLQGMCKVTDSKLRYKVLASGANTFSHKIRLLGYYTKVDIIPPTTSRLVSPKGVRIA